MRSPVVKNLLAALAGYVTLFALLFGSFSIVWQILGADGAFRPGTWDVSGGWIGASIVLGLAVAVVGGLVCAKLQANRHGLYILIGIIVILSIFSIMPDSGAAPTGPRPPDVGMMDAMSNARQPTWILWLNPLIGIVGVIVGARLAGRKSAPQV